MDRKHIFEQLCLAVAFVHSKQLVLNDLKPQNVVIFGSLLSIKLIDFEGVRKAGEHLPFRLTPFYTPPELAAAALEAMRLGSIPQIGWTEPTPPAGDAPPGSSNAADSATDSAAGSAAGADRWGANVKRMPLVAEDKALAQAAAAASGDGAAGRANARHTDAILRNPSGKPLRAAPVQDAWSLGMILYELFANEAFFAGCSDDVALQVLAAPVTLELPTARISNTQALHLLQKLLVKKPRERATVEVAMKHAYLTGGLDTQEVQGTFAMLHESQQTFRDALEELRDLTGAADEGGAGAAPQRPPGGKPRCGVRVGSG